MFLCSRGKRNDEQPLNTLCLRVKRNGVSPYVSYCPERSSRTQIMSLM